ncbi:hypothetical protein CYMTET_13892 [Cymbomonas tetramitiformis]|uniref:PTM/DIR17-like Tudor domain-containing protein n=1 Tax=Cymbomonas tetramitiformis TaxID=36881 RepID=A0AAE0GHR4_9CHLO|nr:hypothetical protein CYMTET_13892 [Cymbomonas tetramitiformis]
MASFVGLKLKKDFDGHGAFEGEVVKYDKKDPQYPFQVRYIDGDQEDLSREELLTLLIDPVPTEDEDAPKSMKAAARSVKPSATTPTQPASKRPRRSLNDKSPATTSELGRCGETLARAGTGSSAGVFCGEQLGDGTREQCWRILRRSSWGAGRQGSSAERILRGQLGRVRFSSTVTYNGVIYMAGEVASDTSDSSVKGQLTQCLKQVEAKLDSAGSSKSRVLRVTLVVSDISKVGEVNEAWDEWVDAAQRPVRATFQGSLVDPKYVVEVIAEAAIGQAQIVEPEPAPLPQPEPVPNPLQNPRQSLRLRAMRSLARRRPTRKWR